MRPANSASAGRVRGDEGVSAGEDGEGVPRERTPLSALPFHGGNIVEFSSLTAFDSTTHLEIFLSQFETGRLAPIVRSVNLWLDGGTCGIAFRHTYFSCYSTPPSVHSIDIFLPKL